MLLGPGGTELAVPVFGMGRGRFSCKHLQVGGLVPPSAKKQRLKRCGSRGGTLQARIRNFFNPQLLLCTLHASCCASLRVVVLLVLLKLLACRWSDWYYCDARRGGKGVLPH